jgi:hypothetical protein
MFKIIIRIYYTLIEMTTLLCGIDVILEFFS